jgi:hypothetical protein
MYFPITIVDNFYDDPDSIVEQAEQFKFYTKEEWGTAEDYWPGKRTKPLGELDYTLFNFSCKRILGLMYEKIPRFNCHNIFQKISAPPKVLNAGWIHCDIPAVLSCILYLTKGESHGTSFYKPKKPGSDNVDGHVQRYYNTAKGANIKPQDYNKGLLKNNNQFIKTVEVEGVYNRAVLFDSSEWHGANAFGTSGERLIQVFFFTKIDASWFPLPAFKREHK